MNQHIVCFYHNSEISRRTDDLLVVEWVEIKIAKITSTHHASFKELKLLVARQKGELCRHSTRSIVRTDQDRTTTSSGGESKVLRISLNVGLISRRRSDTESLIDVLSYDMTLKKYKIRWRPGQ